MGGRRKRTPIGLDIGVSGVRAVRLTREGDRFAVSSAALTEPQPEACADTPGDADHAGELTRRIQSCLRMGEFRGRSAVAALNPPAVEFHTLELPPAVMTDQDSDADQVVRWEVGRLTNEPVDSVEVGHWALPHTEVPAPNVIGVAARRDAVARTLKTCSDAGLLCIRIDTGAAALGRFGTILNGWKPEAVWGVLDVGYSQARLVLCVDDVPVLVRRAGSGGRIWTERIAESLRLSVKAAEVHKCDHGIAVGSRRELASILLGVLRSELKELASEVKRSYEYVLGCYPQRRAADLVLVGGGALMPNLPEFLGDALGILVRRASDYLEGESCRLRYASGKQGRLEVLAAAIGLAVGENVETSKSQNVKSSTF